MRVRYRGHSGRLLRLILRLIGQRGAIDVFCKTWIDKGQYRRDRSSQAKRRCDAALLQHRWRRDADGWMAQCAANVDGCAQASNTKLFGTTLNIQIERLLVERDVTVTGDQHVLRVDDKPISLRVAVFHLEIGDRAAHG